MLVWLYKAATVHVQKLCFKRVRGKESLNAQEDTSKIGNTLSYSCGKYKLMATYAENSCWNEYEIRYLKYEILISKVDFRSILKYFYQVIY